MSAFRSAMPSYMAVPSTVAVPEPALCRRPDSLSLDWIRLLLVAVAVVVPISCGGGGGGGGAGDEAIAETLILEDAIFLDPNEQLVPSGSGPTEASLAQGIRLVFSSRVVRDEVDSESLAIVESETRRRVPTTFTFSKGGTVVTVRPTLPLRPWRLTLGEWDMGGAALSPGSTYELFVPVAREESIPRLIGLAPKLADRSEEEGHLKLSFHTTSEESRFWTGLPQRAPKLISLNAGEEGDKQIAPNFFNANAPVVFTITFDTPLTPFTELDSRSMFRLKDLGGPGGQPSPFDLTLQATMTINEPDRSVIELTPWGLLPQGHDVALRSVTSVVSLSGGLEGSGFDETYKVEDNGRSNDALKQIPSQSALAEIDPLEHPEGSVPAQWNPEGNGALEVNFGFPGRGELGRFVPFADSDEKLIELNTESQEFPLLDGSTPDSPRVVIEGGVFNFSDVFIPHGVKVRGVGVNPLVITSTSRFELAGEIDVGGAPGASEIAQTDRALAPLPGGEGGPGGATGGDGHPTRRDGSSNIVSPKDGNRAETIPGTTIRGGYGGQSGIDSSHGGGDICVGGSDPLSRGGGGGGGSLATLGSFGDDGLGDLTSAEELDSQGYQIFVPLPDGIPRGGAPGPTLFEDANPNNDFFGWLGERPFNHGGEGGGGGGSRLDSFYCGSLFPGLPETIADARGGGGGGGGGAVEVRALGEILLVSPPDTRTRNIAAHGGDGGFGEPIALGDRGGGGGGGAGGLIRLISAAGLRVVGEPLIETLDVSGGAGGGLFPNKRGGPGGSGLVQIEVANPEHLDLPEDLVAPEGALIAPELTRSDLVSLSVGLSRWIDLGVGATSTGGPRFAFRGVDEKGYIITDENGRVISPETADIRVVTRPVIDPLTGEILIPGRTDALPDNASVRIEFQGAHPLAADPYQPDPKTMTAWSPSIKVLDGHQYIRFRVTMDIAKDGQALHPDLQRPAVVDVRLRFEI